MKWFIKNETSIFELSIVLLNIYEDSSNCILFNDSTKWMHFDRS